MNKNSPFCAKGCVLEQNSKKETTLKIKFYYQCIITLPLTTIPMLCVMILVWLWGYFYTFLPCNQQQAICFPIFLSL